MSSDTKFVILLSVFCFLAVIGVVFLVYTIPNNRDSLPESKRRISHASSDNSVEDKSGEYLMYYLIGRNMGYFKAK